MEYRNVKTGEVITTSTEITGRNWERIVKIPIEKASTEEVPAEKDKTSRRGKK